MPDSSPPRLGRSVALAVVLGVLAGAAVWAAFSGVGPASFDEAALDEAIAERTPTLTTLAVIVTTLGSTVAMARARRRSSASGAWLRGRRADAVLAIGAMAGASLVFRLIKVLLDRSRPPAADRLVAAANESLPSGHATMSTRGHRHDRGAGLVGAQRAGAGGDGGRRRGVGRRGRRHPGVPRRALDLGRARGLGRRRGLARACVALCSEPHLRTRVETGHDQPARPSTTTSTGRRRCRAPSRRRSAGTTAGMAVLDHLAGVHAAVAMAAFNDLSSAS